MRKPFLCKLMALLLIVSMLLVSFVSCGDEPVDTTKATQTETTTAPTDTTSTPDEVAYPDQIKDLKDITNGSKITFIFVDGVSGGYTADSIWVDPEAGDLDDVDTGIIERNAKIQEDLGVTIDPYLVSTVGIDGLQEFTKSTFDAQLPDIDVYCGYQYFDISLATQKHLYNLNDLVNPTTGETLIDIEQPYWATNYINSITYNDYVYWVTGDLSLRYTGGLYCTFVNTELYDTRVKAAYDGRTIYQIVNDGDWTMETMIKMADLADDDVDGDGKISQGEIAGFVYQNNDIWDGMAFGCQVEFGKKVTTLAGIDEITVNLNLDKKASDFAAYCHTLYEATYTLGVSGTDSQELMNTFANGEALFAVNQLYQSPIFLSEMESFAIVPTPKLNKSQQNYASGCHDSLTLYGISRYSDVPIAAAATLELMAYYGNSLVAPVFYKSYILGGRTVREDESIEMIELIRKGFDSDFVAAWSHSIADIVHIYRVPGNCKNFSSICKYQSTVWPRELNELIDALEKAAVEE